MIPGQGHPEIRANVNTSSDECSPGDVGLSQVTAASSPSDGDARGRSNSRSSHDKIFTIIAAAAMQQAATPDMASATADGEASFIVLPHNHRWQGGSVTNSTSVITTSPGYQRNGVSLSATTTTAGITDNAKQCNNSASNTSAATFFREPTSPSTSTSTLPMITNNSTNSKERATASKKEHLRKGKWTPEEEEYASRIIYFFQNGMLQLPEGSTLRSFLAAKLNCDPMRITKKIAGASCLGKRMFHLGDRAQASPREMGMAKAELEQLEDRFKLRQKLGNCNLPLHVWPELCKQRFQIDATPAHKEEQVHHVHNKEVLPLPPRDLVQEKNDEATSGMKRVAGTISSSTTTDQPTAMTQFFESYLAHNQHASLLPPSVVVQEKNPEATSGMKRVAGTRSTTSTADDPTAMMQFFQSYLALQATSASSPFIASPSSTQPAPASSTTTKVQGVAGQSTQQHQPMERATSNYSAAAECTNTNFLSQAMLSLICPPSSSTFGATTDSSYISTATAAVVASCIGVLPQTRTSALPLGSSPQMSEQAQQMGTALASGEFQKISPHSINHNLWGSTAVVNQQQRPLPSHPAFPMLPLSIPSAAGLPTSGGNNHNNATDPQSVALAQCMAWANIAQVTQALFQIAAANSASCFQQQQQPWATPMMPSITASFFPATSNFNINSSSIPPQQQQIPPQFLQPQPQFLPKVSANAQTQERLRLLQQAEIIQQSHEDKQQLGIQKSSPSTPEIDRQCEASSSMNNNKISESSVQKDEVASSAALCQEDEDASNTLLGLMSSLRQNYDKALSGQHRHINQESSIHNTCHKAILASAPNEKKNNDLAALQENFHKALLSQQQAKAWSSNASNKRSTEIMSPPAEDYSTATFVTRSSVGHQHLWKKSSGVPITPGEAGPATSSSMKRNDMIRRSITAPSLVSNQTSDISDDSERSGITKNRSRNESSKFFPGSATTILRNEHYVNPERGEKPIRYPSDSGDSVVSSIDDNFESKTTDRSSSDEPKTGESDSSGTRKVADEVTAATKKRRRKSPSEFTSKNVADHTTLMNSLENENRRRPLW